MPLCFALGLSGPYLSWAAGGFVLGYGAINGLTTVFKATLPLQLLPPRIMPGEPVFC